MIGEARCRRRQRHRHELADQCRAELAEVRLKVAVEVSRMRLLSWQRGFAVDDEPVRAEQIAEQRGEVSDRR